MSLSSIHTSCSYKNYCASNSAHCSSTDNAPPLRHNFTGARRRMVQQLVDQKILLPEGGFSPKYADFCMPALNYEESALILAEFAKIHPSTLEGETSYFSFGLLLQNFLQRISQEQAFQAYEISKAYIVGSYVMQILFYKTSYCERVFKMLGLDTSDLLEHLDLQESASVASEAENKSSETDLDLRFKVKYRHNDQRLSYLEMHSFSDIIIQYVAALHPSHSKEKVRDRGGFENLASPDDARNCFRLLQLKGTNTDIVIYSDLWVKNIFNSDNLYLDIAEILSQKTSPQIYVGAHQGSVLFSFLYYALRLNDVSKPERLDKSGWLRFQSSNHKGFPFVRKCEEVLFAKMSQEYHLEGSWSAFENGYNCWLSKHKVEPLFFLLAVTFSLHRNYLASRELTLFFRRKLAQLADTPLQKLIWNISLEPDPLLTLSSLFHLAGFLQSDPRKTSLLLSTDLIEYKIGTSYFYFPTSSQEALNIFLERSSHPYVQQIFFYLLPPQLKDNNHPEIDACSPLPVLLLPPQKYTPIIHYVGLYLTCRDPKIDKETRVRSCEVSFIHLLPLMHIPGMYHAFEEILGLNFFPETETSLPKEEALKKWLEHLFFSQHFKSAFLVWEQHFTLDLFSFTLNLIKKLTKQGYCEASRLYFLLKRSLEKEQLDLQKEPFATEWQELLVECSSYGTALSGQSLHFYQEIALSMQSDLFSLCQNTSPPSLESIEALFNYVQRSNTLIAVKNPYLNFVLLKLKEHLASLPMDNPLQSLLRSRVHTVLIYSIEQLLDTASAEKKEVEEQQGEERQVHFFLASDLAAVYAPLLTSAQTLKIFLHMQTYALKHSLHAATLAILKPFFRKEHFLLEGLDQEEEQQIFQLLLESLYQEKVHFDDDLISLFFHLWTENVKAERRENFLTLLRDNVTDLSAPSPLHKFIQLYLLCLTLPQQSPERRDSCQRELLEIYPLIHHATIAHFLREEIGEECLSKTNNYQISQEWIETLFMAPQIEEHAFQLWKTNFDQNSVQFTLHLIEKLLQKDLQVALKLYTHFKSSLKHLYEKKLVAERENQQLIQLLCHSALFLKNLKATPSVALQRLSHTFAKDLFIVVHKNRSLKKEILQALLLYSTLVEDQSLREKLLKLSLDHLEIDEQGHPKERELARELMRKNFTLILPERAENISQESLTLASRFLREKEQFLTPFEHLTYLLILHRIGAKNHLVFTDERLIFNYLHKCEEQIASIPLKDQEYLLSIVSRRLEKKEPLPISILGALTKLLSSSQISAEIRFQLLHLLIFQKHKIILEKEAHSAWCHYLYASMARNIFAENWIGFSTLFAAAEEMGNFPPEIYAPSQLILAEHLENTEIQKSLLFKLCSQLNFVDVKKLYALLEKTLERLKIEDQLKLLDSLFEIQKESFGLVELFLSTLEKSPTPTSLDLLLKHPFPQQERRLSTLLFLLEQLPSLGSLKERVESSIILLITADTSLLLFKKLALTADKHRLEIKFRLFQITALKVALATLNKVEPEYIKPLLLFFNALLKGSNSDLKQSIYEERCAFITKIKADKNSAELILKESRDIPSEVSINQMQETYLRFINCLLNENPYATPQKLEFCLFIITHHPEFFNLSYCSFHLFFTSLSEGKELLNLLNFFQKNCIIEKLCHAKKIELLNLKLKIIDSALQDNKIKHPTALFDLIAKNHPYFQKEACFKNRYVFMRIFNRIVEIDFKKSLNFFYLLNESKFFEENSRDYPKVLKKIFEECIENKFENYFDFLTNFQKYIFSPLMNRPSSIFDLAEQILVASPKFFSSKDNYSHFMALQELYARLSPLFTLQEIINNYGESLLSLKKGDIDCSLITSLYSHKDFAQQSENLLIGLLEDSLLSQNYWGKNCYPLFKSIRDNPHFLASTRLLSIFKKIGELIDKYEITSFPCEEALFFIQNQPNSDEKTQIILDYWHLVLKYKVASPPWHFLSSSLLFCTINLPNVRENTSILKIMGSLKKAVQYYLNVYTEESVIASQGKFTFMYVALTILSKRVDLAETLETIYLLLPLIIKKLTYCTKIDYWHIIIHSLHTLSLTYPHEHEKLSILLIKSLSLLPAKKSRVIPNACQSTHEEVSATVSTLSLCSEEFYNYHALFIKMTLSFQNDIEKNFQLEHRFKEIVVFWTNHISDSSLAIDKQIELIKLVYETYPKREI